jgi:hypothetical protein
MFQQRSTGFKCRRDAGGISLRAKQTQQHGAEASPQEEIGVAANAGQWPGAAAEAAQPAYTTFEASRRAAKAATRSHNRRMQMLLAPDPNACCTKGMRAAVAGVGIVTQGHTGEACL